MNRLFTLVHVNLSMLHTDEGGQGIIEYGLLAGLISIAAVGVLTLVGMSIPEMFGWVNNVGGGNNVVH